MVVVVRSSWSNPLARRDSWGEASSWVASPDGGTPGGNLTIDAGVDQAITLPADASLAATLGVPVSGVTSDMVTRIRSGWCEFFPAR